MNGRLPRGDNVDPLTCCGCPALRIHIPDLSNGQTRPPCHVSNAVKGVPALNVDLPPTGLKRLRLPEQADVDDAQLAQRVGATPPNCDKVGADQTLDAGQRSPLSRHSGHDVEQQHSAACEIPAKPVQSPQQLIL